MPVIIRFIRGTWHKKGDRIGTLGWNHHRHLEAYFAVPNMNAVLHTINFRLPQEHLIYVINDAEDKVLLVDAQFIGLIEAIKDEILLFNTSS